MAMAMDRELMGGEFFVPRDSPGIVTGTKNVTTGLRAISLKRKAAYALEPVESEWRLERMSEELSVPSPQSLNAEERTWRALEPTVVGNRVQWTCTVAPTTPRCSDIITLPSIHCSPPTEDSRELVGGSVGPGIQDNLSDHSLTSTLTNDSTDLDSVNLMMPGLDSSFEAAGTAELAVIRRLLDEPVSLGSDPGYSEFELLSTQFPMITPDFKNTICEESCGSRYSDPRDWSARLNEKLHSSVEYLPGCIEFESDVNTSQRDFIEQETVRGRDSCSLLFAEEQMRQQQMPESSILAGFQAESSSASVQDEEEVRYKEQCCSLLFDGEQMLQQQQISDSSILVGFQAESFVSSQDNEEIRFKGQCGALLFAEEQMQGGPLVSESSKLARFPSGCSSSARDEEGRRCKKPSCGVQTLFAEERMQQMSDSSMFAGIQDESSGSVRDEERVCCKEQQYGSLFAESNIRAESCVLAQDSVRYKEECSGVELVQQLLACANAIAADQTLAATQHVLRLSELMSPRGSPMERVATYFTDALAAWLEPDEERRVGFWKGSKVEELRCKEFKSTLEETMTACRVFYDSCPYLIITHFTANQAILEAFEGEEKVHVVDLDMKHGLQWPSLIQALSYRPGGPPQVRITSVAGACPDLPSMMATKKRLLEFADTYSVPLEFIILNQNLETLQGGMLDIREHEALAVNCVSSLHQLIDNPRRSLLDFLLMIRNLEPSVVTVVEQDANHERDFLPRFEEALHYFSSMFDSVAAGLSSSLGNREMVERLILGKEIMRIVGPDSNPASCSDQHRYNGRHQTAVAWIQHMSDVGFQCRPLTRRSTFQAELLLDRVAASASKYYCFVKDDGRYLSLGWQNKPLYSISCWSCTLSEAYPSQFGVLSHFLNPYPADSPSQLSNPGPLSAQCCKTEF